MRWVVVAGPDGGGELLSLAADHRPAGPIERVTGLAAAVLAREAGRPRWVWPDTPEIYPGLLRAGGRVDRCHDLALTEALLSGYHGRWGEPRGLPAAWARLRGLPVPADLPHRSAGPIQPALFEPDSDDLPGAASVLDAVVAVHADQHRRIAGVARPDRFRLLVAAESAGALTAAEMGLTGLPWRADVHDALLTEQLGARPPGGGRPPKLAELADAIGAAFGGHRLNPDSPADLLRAFRREGLTLPSTRAHVLRRLQHPVVPLLLRYKELARLHSANGWAFLDTWVHDGRFHAGYVAGGVVSGRWATRGGGALQIPRSVRRAVVADPGYTLVVADAGQLEPRLLAAMSGDRRMAEAAGPGDLYSALAADSFDGDRAKAKLALLGAMYGGTSGGSGPLLAVLRRRFPAAMELVEQAARTGEDGGLVRSWLGRTCPPPSATWWQRSGLTPADTAAQAGLTDWAGTPDGADGPEPPEPGGRYGRGDSAVRSRGRFTRNFVVQATAAEWALILLAELRAALRDIPGAELVFFQHDEVIVHCPHPAAEQVVKSVEQAGRTAGELLFGPTPVHFPLGIATVECYGDAK